MLELIKSPEITENTVVAIKSTAHPNILSLPAIFANHYDIYRIIFTDEHNNCVIMEPRRKTVEATFWSGGNLTLGLPTDYESYRIRVYTERAIITDADLDFIAHLKNARSLRITAADNVDNFDVASRLLKRVDVLKTMPKLLDLMVSIFPNTFKGLSVKALLEESQSLRLFTLDVERRFSQEEIGEIVESVAVPDGWHVSTDQYGQIDFLGPKLTERIN